MIDQLKEAVVIVSVFGVVWLCMDYIIVPVGKAVTLRVLEIACAPILIGLHHSFKKQTLRIPKDPEKRTRMMLGATFMLLYTCVGFPLTLLLFYKAAMQAQLDPSGTSDIFTNTLWPAMPLSVMFAIGLFIVYRISNKTTEQDHDAEYFKRANFYQNAWKFITWIVALIFAFFAGKNL